MRPGRRPRLLDVEEAVELGDGENLVDIRPELENFSTPPWAFTFRSG